MAVETYNGIKVLAEKKGERNRRYFLIACPKCGIERWVHPSNARQKAFTGLCRDCWKLTYMVKGERNVNWKGGRKVIKTGYIKIRLLPTDFFYPMVAQDGYVLEHRLIVAKALGRNLHRWEIVHHKKGFAKDDNRYPITLQLVTDDRHKQITILEMQITDLQKQVRLLKFQVKELNSQLMKIKEGV